MRGYIAPSLPALFSMTQQIKCPACFKWLYFPDFSECNEEHLESICGNCKYKYALMSLTAKVSYSYIEDFCMSRPNLQIPYRRIYETLLIQKDGTSKIVQFSALGQAEKFSALPGNEVLLLYLMQGKSVKDLVRIINQTTGNHLLLLRPNTKAISHAFVVTIKTVATSFIVAGLLHIPTNKPFWTTVIPSSVGVGAYVYKRQNLKVRDRQELTRLNGEQQLLSQKWSLQERTQVLQQELENNSRLIDRLEALKQKMLNAPEELYTYRISTVSKGIKIVVEQFCLTHELIVGYGQIISMLTIDYEMSRLAEQIPEDLSGTILGRLEEMKLVEAKREELSLLANPQKLLS